MSSVGTSGLLAVSNRQGGEFRRHYDVKRQYKEYQITLTYPKFAVNVIQCVNFLSKGPWSQTIKVSVVVTV